MAVHAERDDASARFYADCELVLLVCGRDVEPRLHQPNEHRIHRSGGRLGTSE
jgi:hypothetical protein